MKKRSGEAVWLPENLLLRKDLLNLSSCLAQFDYILKKEGLSYFLIYVQNKV